MYEKKWKWFVGSSFSFIPKAVFVYDDGTDDIENEKYDGMR